MNKHKTEKSRSLKRDRFAVIVNRIATRNRELRAIANRRRIACLPFNDEEDRVHKEIAVLELKLAEARSGFRIGDSVQYEAKHGRWVGLVTEVRKSNANKSGIAVIVRPYRIDGSLALGRLMLHNLDNPTVVERPSWVRVK